MCVWTLLSRVGIRLVREGGRGREREGGREGEREGEGEGERGEG